MSLQAGEQASGIFPRQRFVRAYFAALVAVLYMKGVDALLTPDGFGAAIWLKPLTLVLVVSISSLLLAPVAMLNTAVFLRPQIKNDGGYWQSVRMWAVRIVYAALVLYSLYHFTASSGLRDELLGLLFLLILTVLNHHSQRANHPFLFLIALTVMTAIVPLFILLRPVNRLTNDSPILWVTKTYDYSSRQTTPVYWQPYQSVFLQWKGKNYRLQTMSPAFASRRNEIITLEGRELVVTSTTGAVKRISLKSHIPNYHFILNMQPTLDGVMLNVYAPSSDHYVVRVDLQTDKVGRVPQAFRVRCAEATDRYIVNWSKGRTHQVRDGHDRLVRQHGFYPWHFREWDADPVDDLFAITSRSDVTLIGPDSFTMSTINPGVPVASVTMQPGHRQIWIAEVHRDDDTHVPSWCRLHIFAYNGRLLGERRITGGEVIRATPVKEATARYLLQKYEAVVIQ